MCGTIEWTIIQSRQVPAQQNIDKPGFNQNTQSDAEQVEAHCASVFTEIDHHLPCGGFGHNLRPLCSLVRQLHVCLHLAAPLLGPGAQVRGEQLHDQDGEDDQDKHEVPGRHHGFVEKSVEAGFGAEAVTGAVAGKVRVHFVEGQLSQEEEPAGSSTTEHR